MKQDGNHAWYWNPDQLLRTDKVMNLRREFTITSFKDHHNFTYIVNLIIIPQVCLPSLTEESPSLEQMETITENLSWTQCSDQWIMETQA